MTSRLIPLALTALLAPSLASAAGFKLYTTVPGQSVGTATSTAASSATGVADSTELTAPAPPAEGIADVEWAIPPNTADVLANSATTGLGVSRNQQGNFWGLSIELSVVNRILGTSSEALAVPFLNYMANIQARAGVGPRIRVGGNSQEGSELFPSGLESGDLIEKTSSSSSVTPQVDYSIDLLYLMSNISDLVGAGWYMGLDFADPNNQSKAEEAYKYAEEILGSQGALLGVQMGNEPDLYASSSGRRTGEWNISLYETQLTTAMDNIAAWDSNLPMNNFMLPSVCCSWTPDEMIATGLLDTYASRMNVLSFQKYPFDNCDAASGETGQNIFSQYLNHTLATSLVYEYEAAANEGAARGLDVIMAETNSASCSGFAGLSDSFGIAMWLTDWAFTLAYRNFTSALLHTGGQSAFYNPFTPPATNESSLKQWTTGSPYYSSIFVAEAFGSSNTSQIVDLTGGGTDTTYQYTPAYAIYEGGEPARVVLFNYVSDQTGASDYTATLSGFSTTPAQVEVRYLRAPTVSEQYNITYAGQTLGGSWESDGTLKNDRENITISCDQTNGNCLIPVYAPSIALVFLTDEAYTESTPSVDSKVEYSTTVQGATATLVPSSVLETSNGHGGKQWTVKLGSTSNESGSSSGAEGRLSLGGVGVALALVAVGGLTALL